MLRLCTQVLQHVQLCQLPREQHLSGTNELQAEVTAGCSSGVSKDANSPVQLNRGSLVITMNKPEH